MRAIVLFILLYIFAYADFTLTYKLDNTTLQTVNYADKKHVLFTIYSNGELVEKLLILNDKKYIIFNEDNIEHIYEISDELSEPVKESNITATVEYKFIKKIKDTKIAGIKAEKWLVENSNNEKTPVIVSNSPDIVADLFKVMDALKKILPANKQDEAYMFNMGKGYVLLATGDLKLISYNKDKLSTDIFNLKPLLDNSQQEKMANSIDKCFSEVCCGKESSDAKELKPFLKTKIGKWQLKKVAKCNNDIEKNIESAIYTDSNNSHIVVEMTTGDVVPSGKIDSLIEQGIKVSDIKKTNLDGFRTVSAYIPVVDATVVDIMLPNTTISLYSKGKAKLEKFAKQVLNLKVKNIYSTSGI